MVVLKSDVGVASQIATTIAGSLDGAMNSGSAFLFDTQTTVAGNTNAQTAIQALVDAQNKLVQAVGQASVNLQTVASEFEAADQATRQLMAQLSTPTAPRGVQK